MATTSYKVSGAQASVDRGTTPTWGSLTNLGSSNNAYATVSTSPGNNTDYLRLTSFGFTTSDIPANSRIDGIEVSIECKASAFRTVYDETVKLRKTSGQVGDNKAVTTWGSADSTVVYGSSSDLWGTTWTADDIYSSDFGVDFAVNQDAGDSGGAVTSVDIIQIRVTYTPGKGFPFRNQSKLRTSLRR